jgi:hypothetical protein
MRRSLNPGQLVFFVMLLHEPCPHQFSDKRLRRLRLLERALFENLPGPPLPTMRTADYAALLVSAGELEETQDALASPSVRRLLERDLRDFAAWCDAFVPLQSRSGTGFEIDLAADADAVRFFLGESWLEEPLRPKLSSAVVRAFMLAKDDGAELRFGYRARRKVGEPWQARHTTGQPIALVPGSDSAYLQLWNGRERFRINLARIVLPVIRTGRTLSSAPSSTERVRYRLDFEQEADARALVETFHGLTRTGTRVEFDVAEEAAVMTLDRLAAYLWRTRDRPGEQGVLHLPGVTVVRLNKQEDASS